MGLRLEDTVTNLIDSRWGCELDKEVVRRVDVLNHPQQAISEARNLKDIGNIPCLGIRNF